MPFTVIMGTFHLVGKTSAGRESGFEPDGDSIQFKPADASLLSGLERVGSAFRLTTSARHNCALRASTRWRCISAAHINHGRWPTRRATC